MTRPTLTKTLLLTMLGTLAIAPGALAEPTNAPPWHHEPLCPHDVGPGKYYCKAWVRTDGHGHPLTFAPLAGTKPPGLGADDIAAAYNLDTTLKPGATIGIVDAYGYPNAEADLAKYRSQYNLPPCTVASGCLKIVNQMGQTSPLPKANTGWEGETALDLDMASATCPNCKIVLVQSNDESNDNLDAGEQVAATLGATVISNSWGGAEDPSEPGSSQEHFFMTTPPATIFVAAGDSGYDNGGQGADYPSTSAYVIGVGGTSLTQDSSARGWTETVWNGGGSSCGTTIPTPSWQKGMMTDCTMRAAADIAAVGDPNTGVAMYQGSWQVTGGTSVASPLVAGIFALTGNAGVTPDWVYKHNTIWNDVTSGNNNQGGSGASACPNNGMSILCNAGPGWDGPTGWGTPDGKKMLGATTPPDMATPLDMTVIPDLAQPPPPPDMAQPAGNGGSGGSGGGVGGNGANGGNTFTGGNKGCGCSVGAAPSRGSEQLALAGLVFAFVFVLARRRRG